MASVPKRKRGRPLKFTPEQRKARKKEYQMRIDMERAKGRVYIAEHMSRWNRLKEQLGFMYNHELAGYLLDRYEYDEHTQELVTKYSTCHRDKGGTGPNTSYREPLIDCSLRENEQTSGLKSSVAQQGKFTPSSNVEDPSLHSKETSNDISLQLEVDDGAESIDDDESVDEDSSSDLDLEDEEEMAIKEDPDSEEYTPQNSGSTPQSESTSKSVESGGDNPSHMITEVKQEPVHNYCDSLDSVLPSDTREINRGELETIKTELDSTPESNSSGPRTASPKSTPSVHSSVLAQNVPQKTVLLTQPIIKRVIPSANVPSSNMNPITGGNIMSTPLKFVKFGNSLYLQNNSLPQTMLMNTQNATLVNQLGLNLQGTSEIPTSSNFTVLPNLVQNGFISSQPFIVSPAKTVQLLTGGQQILAGAQQPTIIGQQPTIGTLQPTTCTIGGQQHVLGGQQPVIGTLQPTIGGQQPTIGTVQHIIRGQQSTIGGQQFTIAGQQPTKGGQQPTIGGQQPTIGGQQPTVGGQQPTIGTLQPTIGGQQFTIGGQQPTIGGQQHSIGGQQPTIGGQQPTIGTLQSTIGGRQSTVGGQQSTVGGQQSTIGGQQPTIGGQQSTIGTLQHIIGGHQHTIGGQQHAIGQQLTLRVQKVSTKEEELIDKDHEEEDKKSSEESLGNGGPLRRLLTEKEGGQGTSKRFAVRKETQKQEEDQSKTLNNNIEDAEVSSPETSTGRFKTVSEREIRSFQEVIQTKSTRKQTRWAAKILNDWHLETYGVSIDMESITAEELAVKLEKFYCEAKPQPDPKNKSYEEYNKNTMKAMRAAINRHFSDIGRDFDIVNDRQFKLANRSLIGLLKHRMAEGTIHSTIRKEIIPKSDLQKISKYLETAYSSPINLRLSLWYILAVQFVRRGVEFHHQLNIDSFDFKTDEDGREYACLYHETKLKNNPEVHARNERLMSDTRMYATKSAICPVKMLKFFLSKTDGDATKLFNKYERDAVNCPKGNKIWYNSKPLYKGSFRKFLPDICEQVGCKRYTAYCLRATTIATMNESGFENRHYMYSHS
ncbi:uncharacterized protein LOC133199203 [Saccostrea echinata]|uniref:uncharacterized protein LOC133199203 n=1 Tax=Saccostrea echinata TaxID=191078 RepID=UPI002A8261AC|nr:uncharacterized protein LOC133199203 [Saccostrea echinata]